MVKKFLFFLCLFIFCAAIVFAFGGRQRAEVVQVTGTVRLVGTALFSEIVITDEETDWYIAQDEIEKLYDFQHRTVTVEGEVTRTEITFANGLNAGIRNELKNIRIIEVHGHL